MAQRDGSGEAAFLRRLREELAAWEADGILTVGQAGEIRDRYDFSVADREAGKERNRTVAIVTLAGASLLGLGVILFFAANWPGIPRWGRFAVVFSGMAALFAAGYELGWRKGTFPSTGRAVVVAGCLLYGAGIWLIAQTFNISSHEPNGLLLWALGILPLALALGASPVVTLYAILLASWTCFEVVGFDRPNPVYFPLALATTLPLVYRDRLRFPFWTTVVAVTVALGFDSAHWQGSRPLAPGGHGTMFVLAAWGAVLVLAGSLHGRTGRLAPFRTALRLPGHLLLAALLPALTFRAAFHQPLAEGPAPALPFSIFLVGASAAAAAVLLLEWRRIGADPGLRPLRFEIIVAAWAAFAAAAPVLFPRALPPWAWALSFNLLYAGLCAALVYVADRTRAWLFGYLGVVMFTVLVVCRYFEFAVRLIPKSFVFLAAGGLLLAGGLILEKRRKGAKDEPGREGIR